MSYDITLSPRAARDLGQLRGPVFLRLQTAIEALANKPRPPGCLKITDSPEGRIRVGEYRIRYLIDDAAQQVTVMRIGHRRDIYRS